MQTIAEKLEILRRGLESYVDVIDIALVCNVPDNSKITLDELVKKVSEEISTDIRCEYICACKTSEEFTELSDEELQKKQDQHIISFEEMKQEVLKCINGPTGMYKLIEENGITYVTEIVFEH